MKWFVPPLQAGFWALIAYFLSSQFTGLAFETQASWVFVGGFVGLGLVLDIMALMQVNKAKTSVNPVQLDATVHLVTDGVYRISRNPMYLGLLCYLLGVTYALANPMAAIAPLGFVLLMNATQIKREEAALAQQFGEEYDRYCKEVRRWFGSTRVSGSASDPTNR